MNPNSWSYIWDLLKRKLRVERGGHSWPAEISLRLEFLPLHLLRGFTDQVDVIFSKIVLMVLAGRVMRIEAALIGLPNLYPVLRPAPTAMVPLAYCGMRHMPCRLLATYPLLPPAPSVWSPASLQAQAAIDFFEYFFVRLPPKRPIFGEGLSRLELIAQERSWLVYRRKPALASPPSAAAVGPPSVVKRTEPDRR